MLDKLLLIDGHSILNRAFYGVPDLTNSKGLHTNAVYGFLNILFKVLEEEKPKYLMVAFDVKQKTFRHEMFEAYKGTRKPMPQELHEQVPVIQEVLKAMNIKVVTKPGYEADDVLGTLAFRAEEEGLEVSVISGDRDLLQLATEKIKIRIPKTKKGVTEIENYNWDDVIATYQVTPREFIDLKALMGDASDNIPGVSGIGEKTAAKIISQFHSIENAYEHIDEITPNKAKLALTNEFDIAKLSKKLATIETNVPLDISFAEGVVDNIFNQNAYEMISELEFKSILSRFNTEGVVAEEKLSLENKICEVKSIEEYKAMLDTLQNVDKVGFYGLCIKSKDNEQITFDFLMEGQKSNVIAYAVSTEDNVYIMNSSNIDKSIDELKSDIENIVNSKKISVFGLKKHLKNFGIIENNSIVDCEVAAYLVNPLKDEYSYSDISRDYLNTTIITKDELMQKNDISSLYSINRHNFIMLISCYSYVALKSYDVLVDRLKTMGMYDLYVQIELPLIYSLDYMEKEGVKLDTSSLKEYGIMLKSGIDKLEKEIYEACGKEFNINSPKQLGEVLFESMGIPGGKKTKTGYSTSADVLEKLKEDYPVVGKILEYRQLTKLKSTYADGLVNYVELDGRIHGNFNQTITATGRISSTEPNLQNIPIRMPLGSQIRKVFVPKDGYVFLDADYSQIELRILAHMSNDESLIAAYNEGDDIHKITASKVFGVPLEEVTKEQRSNAKAVNFGIVYGISSFGLSQDLSISRKEASDYIKQYFETYPTIKTFLDEQVQFGKDNGYVTTLFGRRRPIPELKSSNFMQRSFGERIAMNSPIQGTAADIMKVAMIRVDRRLRNENLNARIVLQVHDELLVEAPESEKDIVANILCEEMTKAVDLRVKMDVDVNVGNNWLEAH